MCFYTFVFLISEADAVWGKQYWKGRLVKYETRQRVHIPDNTPKPKKQFDTNKCKYLHPYNGYYTSGFYCTLHSGGFIILGVAIISLFVFIASFFVRKRTNSQDNRRESEISLLGGDSRKSSDVSILMDPNEGGKENPETQNIINLSKIEEQDEKNQARILY